MFFVDRTELDDMYSKRDVLIEPTLQFKENFPLMLASSLANINVTPTVKVRLINPFSTAVSVNQDVIVGTAEDVEEHSILKMVVKNEDKTENR